MIRRQVTPSLVHSLVDFAPFVFWTRSQLIYCQSMVYEKCSPHNSSQDNDEEKKRTTRKGRKGCQGGNGEEDGYKEGEIEGEEEEDEE